MVSPSFRIGLACLSAVIGLSRARAAEPLPETVEFNRDIRPILSDHCFHCHGPDKAKRKAGLRLDTPEGAFADAGDGKAIVPGRPEQSEIFGRITHADGKKRMPPASLGRPLDPRQIALVRRWIEQGAKWQKHWSFLPPSRPPVPPVKDAKWPRNPIDYFILARLEKEGLHPSPEADRVTLIRRVTLDLTGLPPTPAEVDAALSDPSPNWYEKLVDRLLQSPRYGERMAARWLDAARYADTNGYQNDGERTMWRWRDWVIDAFNSNMPFDQFTVEQLAGDLLPRPTLEQRIATGFNRNHRGNAEGGIIPEEYAVEYVVDRVETTSTVWLGLTMGCVRCHDHKYDPIKQQEFYQLFAYFNNVPEHGRAIKYGNSPPYIKAPTPAMRMQLAALEGKIAEADRKVRHLASRLDFAYAEWERSAGRRNPDWAPTDGLLAHYPLDGKLNDRAGRSPEGNFRDGAATFVSGRRGLSVGFDGKRFVDLGNVGAFGFQDKFALAAWVRPSDGRGGTFLSRMDDMERGKGYSVGLKNGKVHVNLVVRWLDDAIRVETERAFPPGQWRHILVTYDGSRRAGGVQIYVDGKPEKIAILLDELNQSFLTKEPLRIGGPGNRFHGAVADVRVYGERLSADDAALVAMPETISDILALAASKRTAGQARKLRAYFLDQLAPEAVRQAHRRRAALVKQKENLEESVPTTMVMVERPTPRETHVLIRGQYDKPGEKVARGVPAALAPLPLGAKNDRLRLARWLVDPANPLPARVTVNRFWQMYFGTGIVKTVDDFGVQGDWPSHPELLDWLATEFIGTGNTEQGTGKAEASSVPRSPFPVPRSGGVPRSGSWNVKAIQKTIVMSAAYRQSSKVTAALLHKDPDNRLLARGPRFRLPAEMVRDQALAASGLLVEKIGGPSVKTYQPASLWKELADADYKQDHGPNLYRRSLYTFWKRTVAPPTMMTFDSAGRETCTVRQNRTNTPLQALILMNEITFVEAARVLAQRVMKEAGPTPGERLTLAFRLATARRPKPAELKILLAGFDRHRAAYQQDRDRALKMLKVGEFRRDPKLDAVELAAYTAVASTILNLDETVTKE